MNGATGPAATATAQQDSAGRRANPAPQQAAPADPPLSSAAFHPAHAAAFTPSATLPPAANDAAGLPLLRSFWMGGFEGADHCNSTGTPLDINHVNGHLERIDEDYGRLARLGIHSVRESLGWRLSERDGRFDFGRLYHIMRAAERHGIQVLWSLLHYGLPDGVDYFAADFAARFCRFAAAAAQALAPYYPEPPIYTPINEINFLAWAVCETNWVHPYRGDPRHGDGVPRDGFALKRSLVAATLAAMDAIRAVDARVRFLHVEPIVHIVEPAGRPDLAEQAAVCRGWQWQAWEMLSGRMEPELGGYPAALDLLGVNYYYNCQWEYGSGEQLLWHRRDPRRLPFSRLLDEAWQRYRRPLLISETGHLGSGRAAWLDEVAAEVASARQSGVPVAGLCLYPLIDRPDWENPRHWHRSGLWDVPAATDPHGVPASQQRVLCLPYACALKRWQRRLPEPSTAKEST